MRPPPYCTLYLSVERQTRKLACGRRADPSTPGLSLILTMKNRSLFPNNPRWPCRNASTESNSVSNPVSSSTSLAAASGRSSPGSIKPEIGMQTQPPKANRIGLGSVECRQYCYVGKGVRLVRYLVRLLRFPEKPGLETAASQGLCATQMAQ